MPENETQRIYWIGSLSWDALISVALAALVALAMPSTTNLYRKMKLGMVIGAVLPPVVSFLIGAIFLMSVLVLMTASNSEFLYFQF